MAVHFLCCGPDSLELTTDRVSCSIHLFWLLLDDTIRKVLVHSVQYRCMHDTALFYSICSRMKTVRRDSGDKLTHVTVSANGSTQELYHKYVSLWFSEGMLYSTVVPQAHCENKVC